MVAKPGLCPAWSETLKTGFLTPQLILQAQVQNLPIKMGINVSGKAEESLSINIRNSVFDSKLLSIPINKLLPIL